MPDTTLTSAELDDNAVAKAMEAFVSNVRGQDPEWTDEYDEEITLVSPDGDGFALEYPIRDAIKAYLSLARAGLEAGKAEESMAARDVLAERKRQVEAEGYTSERDDKHLHGELARAAAAYAVGGGIFRVNALQVPAQVWPYHWEFNPKDERSNLVKAGALIIAEIERLDRAAIRALPLTGGDNGSQQS